MRGLRMLSKWFKIEFARAMAYRGSFIADIIGSVFTEFLGPLFALLLYSSTTGIPGWSFEEFLLMQGIFIFVFGISHAFVEMMAWKTSFFVQEGIFDNVLVRPYNSLLQMMTTSVDMDGFARMGAGLIIIIFALTKLALGISLVNVILFIILIIIAILFSFSVSIMASALSFYVVKSGVIVEMLDSLGWLGQYPLFIYGRVGTFLLSFVFPIGLAAFYPAQVILGRIALPFVIVLAAIGILFFSLSVIMWERAIKHYTSAGG